MESKTAEVATSTEDLKAPGLCFFYFTQPFWILAPEIPRISAVPSHISESFLNMNLFTPFSTSSDDYNTMTSQSWDTSTNLQSRTTDSEFSSCFKSTSEHGVDSDKRRQSNANEKSKTSKHLDKQESYDSLVIDKSRNDKLSNQEIAGKQQNSNVGLTESDNFKNDMKTLIEIAKYERNCELSSGKNVNGDLFKDKDLNKKTRAAGRHETEKITPNTRTNNDFDDIASNVKESAVKENAVVTDGYNKIPSGENESNKAIILNSNCLHSVDSLVFKGIFNTSKQSIPNLNYSNRVPNNVSVKSDFKCRNKTSLPHFLPPLNVDIEKMKIDKQSHPNWLEKRNINNCNRISLPPMDKVNENDIVMDVKIETRIGKVKKVRPLNSGGVTKKTKKVDVRKNISGLLQRTIKGKPLRIPSAFQEVLNTIREAWATPTLLSNRCHFNSGSTTKELSFSPSNMSRRTGFVDPLTPRPSASKGLFTRRYSMPEIIMRKYHLAQQRSDYDTSDLWSVSSRPLSPASSSCGHRYPKRNRELLRKSTMLRRMFGSHGPDPSSSCTDCSRYLSDKDLNFCEGYAQEVKSLDGSRSDLRSKKQPTNQSKKFHGCECFNVNSISSKPPLPGWNTPKRQRINSPCRKNDEMLRMAMKNSYDRSEEQLRFSRKESVSSLVTNSFISQSSETETRHSNDSDSEDQSVIENENFEKKGDEYYNLREAREADSDSAVLENSFLTKKIDTSEILEKTEFEQLEIVVSEKLNRNYLSECSVEKNKQILSKSIFSKPHEVNSNFELDQYVSNILVESLNSLSDQLDEMNASMSDCRKFSIVEKEIKVRLQNRGMNTIVHLSPDSNNPIIFGNKEILEREYTQKGDDQIERFDIENVETKIEEESEVSCLSSEPKTAENIKNKNDNEDIHDIGGVTTNEIFNKAVMQQIQKLFDVSDASKSDISHIEISRVGFYVEEDNANFNLDLENNNSKTKNAHHKISQVTSGNYFSTHEEPVIVPKFSAFPNTESMEVHHSSSDEQDAGRSDPTSLVDSLDDPASPRFYLNRKQPNGLVRSTIDILELIPSSAEQVATPRDKGESFFVRLKEDSLDCDKENVVVAEHLPDLIRQRLIKRHKKRMLRMEQLKRKKLRQMKKEIEKQRKLEIKKARKDLEEECMKILNAIIDDVVLKVASEEQRFVKIKDMSFTNREPLKQSNVKCNRKDNITLDDIESFKINKKGELQFRESLKNISEVNQKPKTYSRKKLSVDKGSPESLIKEKLPKRIYHKSEIQDGKKCVEILEILEYADSSTDASNSDESLNGSKQKSRIPLPVYESVHKIPRAKKVVSSPLYPKAKVPGMTQNLSIDGLDQCSNNNIISPNAIQVRRASVPQTEPRIRTNSSNKYLNTFEKIPEENSVCLESQNEDLHKFRRTELQKKFLKGNVNTQTEEKLTSNKTTSPINKLAANESSSSRKPILTSTSQNLVSRKVDNVFVKDGSKPKKEFTSSFGRTKSIWSGIYKSKKTNFDKEKQESLKTKMISNNEVNKSEKGNIRKKSRNNRISSLSLSSSLKSTYKPFKDPDVDFNLEKSNNDTNDPKNKSDKNNPVLQTNCSSSDSDTDSSSSLLCSLAPKWLHMGHVGRTRKHYRKKVVQEEQTQQNPAGGWSVTVAGNSFTTLPTDVQMRLTFPKKCQQNDHDSGYAEESWKSLRQVAGSLHSSECSNNNCGHGFLPPAQQSRRITMKKESLGSSMQAKKNIRRETDSLPEVKTSYKSRRTKEEQSMKTRRRFSLQCWQKEDNIPPLRSPDNDLWLMGNAIKPERKPRVPTMSERDLTRNRVRKRITKY